MAKIYLTIGLPGSGKSTWSKAFAAKNENVLIVNRDKFREMFKGEYIFDYQYEQPIKEIAEHAVNTFLDCGYDVIIDETNLSRKMRWSWINCIDDGYFNLEIIAVVFTERTNNLEYRMKDSRGFTIDKWLEIIEKMRKIYEEPTDDEHFNEIWHVPFEAVKDGQYD
jgi:tRNA uridine 5-carbamoylmethylation protein Kti12